MAQAARADAILLVVPAQVLRSVVTALAPSLGKGTPLVACAKGIEHGTHKFMSEIIAECAPSAVAGILSGPSFAADVARGLPTAVTVAAADEATATALAHAIGSGTFRPYHSTDVRGVELGGATKNVLAIAAGIVTGRGLGASALAALTTRGFAELTRFGTRLWRAHRNHDGPVRPRRSHPHLLDAAVAQLLLRRRARQGRSGSTAAPASWRKACSPRRCCWRWRAPRTWRCRSRQAVAAVLAEKLSVDEAIESLMTRPFKAEYFIEETSGLLADEIGARCLVVGQQVKKGAKGEAWSGVRNHTAKLNLMKMKKGDRGFFYHSNIGKEVVGIVEIIREHYHDPTAEDGTPWVVVDVKAVAAHAEAGDARRHQGRAEAEGDGAARSSRACRCSR